MTNIFKNHKPYRNMPKVKPIIYDTCAKCKHANVDIGQFNKHEDICEYLYFRDIKAPELGLKPISRHPEGAYIRVLLDMMKIEYHTYIISGISGRSIEIFVKEELATLIDLYFMKEGYAGMTLEEYIMVVTDAKG